MFFNISFLAKSQGAKKMFTKSVMMLVLAVLCFGCANTIEGGVDLQDDVQESTYTMQSAAQESKTVVASDFKLPLSPNYKWEVTQSWAEHCTKCNEKGYDTISNSFYGNYCTEMSHAADCKDQCQYAWDFNLPGEDDLGKPVLVSADGVVLSVKTKTSEGKYESSGWGNTIVIDHGDNACTRYAHLKDDSVLVGVGDQVCQGLKIAEIGGTPNWSPHLHFQFEECNDPYVSVKKYAFDGYAIGEPECNLTADKNFKPLKLTNIEKSSCDEADDGWVQGGCGKLAGCPLNKSCGNSGDPGFKDSSSMDSKTLAAAKYLWSECVVSGKSDGKFHGEEFLTRAEALKIALTLFGLTGKCKVLTVFTDVKPWDWFYYTVKCGVKHGVIKNAINFSPNDQISFAEAAKMLVESGAKKGLIKIIENPSSNHFPNIGESEWAYKYVETLYSYGAIEAWMLDKFSTHKLKRDAYVKMAAALSPCFCGSVQCDDGCACDQGSYSCVKSVAAEEVKQNQPAASGSSGEPQKSSASSSSSCKKLTCYDYSPSCSAFPDDCKPPVKCGVVSDGCGGSINCGSCSSGSLCSYGKCVCTPSCLNKQCGNSDGCGGTCTYCPLGSYCKDGNCVCWPNCSNKQCGDDGCGGSCGQCNAGSNCVDGKCKTPTPPPQPTWQCDPATGYKIYISSPGAYWEALTSGPTAEKYSGLIGNTSFYPIGFNCDELPGALLLKTTNTWLGVGVINQSMPAFGVYVPYNGPININPPYAPDVSTKSFTTNNMYQSVLIRIPAK